MSKIETNPMISPHYINPHGIEKLRVETPALIFGCGEMIHENLFLEFSDLSKVVFYDPDPFNYLNDKINIADKDYDIIKSWEDVSTKPKEYKAIVCFFSLHYVSNWLDKVWELHRLLDNNGELFITEDRGFRALLDFNYDLTSKERLIPESIINEVWQKYFKRIEDGFPWYPDISAGNMTQLREVLSPYYLFDHRTNKDKHEVILERKYIEGEINYYLPWTSKWKLKTKHYPELSSLDTVKEKIIIYKLIKKIEEMPPLWGLNNEEFVNDVWSLKMSHCQRTMIRNSPVFDIKRNTEIDINEFVYNFINSYLTILYQHLLKHLPGGVAEFVSLSPERFYEFAIPSKNNYFKPLPVLSWESEQLALSDTPSWYAKYMSKLASGKFTWGGEKFLVENTGALTYILGFKDRNLQVLDHYYCSHFYKKELTEAYGFLGEPPSDWEKREINPCIYITVQASKGQRNEAEYNSDDTYKPYVSHNEIRYVGFVLYLPSIDVDEYKNKYIIIGGVLSHLLSYVQSQVSTFLAVSALDVAIPPSVREFYEIITMEQLGEVHNKMFPASNFLDFLKQHDMNDITYRKTNHNYYLLNPSEKEMLKKYFSKLGLSGFDFFDDDVKCKLLKAMLGRDKETFYLFDTYFDIIKTHKTNRIFNESIKIVGNHISTNAADYGFECKDHFAFWYIKHIIDTLLDLRETDGIILKDVFMDKQNLLIITTGEIYPEVFNRETSTSFSGSFSNYVKILLNNHYKLLGTDHTFLYLKYPCKYSEFTTVKISDFFKYVPPPKHQIPKLPYIQLSHVYISFDDVSFNGIILRKHGDSAKEEISD